MVLQIIQILVKDTELSQAKAKLDEILNSNSTASDKRKETLNEIKKLEGQIRKLENDLTARTDQQLQTRGQLEEQQSAAQQA